MLTFIVLPHCLLDSTLSHIILTLGRPVLALPRTCQAGSNYSTVLGFYQQPAQPSVKGDTIKRIKILHPVAKTPRYADPRRTMVDRQVKIDCPLLPVPFAYKGNSIYLNR